MTNALTPFNFQGADVRTVMIDSEPWFIAADVAFVLGLSNHHSSLVLLDQDERGIHTVETPGGLVKYTIISESGLYSFVLRSRREEAKEFKRWITREVLPQIRKTGSYSAVPRDDLSLMRSMIDAIESDRAAVAALAAGQQEILTRQAQLEQRQEILEENHERYAAIGYANLRKIRSDVSFLNRLGTRAAKLARRDGIEVSRVHSTVWGEVNAWPLEIWDEACAELS